MIWESSYWKEELFRYARRIKRRQTLKKWTERTTAGLEKDLMVGFYSIRKLIEAHKVSDEIRDRDLRLEGYPWTESPVTFMNWHKIDQKYNLQRPITLRKSVISIANQLIHSFVFMPCFDEAGRLVSLLFNSDRTRRQHLYSVAIDDVVALFEEVAGNDPASMHCQFNEDSGDYSVSVGPTMVLDPAASNTPLQPTAEKRGG